MVSRPPSPVRTIFFDAGNTLVRMNYATIGGALARHGLTAGGDADAVQRAEWRARVRLDEFLQSQRAPGTEASGTADLYLALILEELGARDPALVTALTAWRRTYNLPVGIWNVADPEAEAALRLARGAGLGTAVISNSNGSIRAILEDLGLAAHLDFVIDSSEVGVEKPDARIFRLALERAGVAPAAAVYVGDLYSIDVRGARAAGMPAVLLDPGGWWGARDCPTASGVLAAVRLILEGPPLTPAGSRRDSGGARRR
ncbi:MAG: HAD family hydrolase [Candidatus Rokuibacteriota bacterium]